MWKSGDARAGAGLAPIDRGGRKPDEQLARREKRGQPPPWRAASGVKKAATCSAHPSLAPHRLQKYGLDAHGDEIMPRITPVHLQREPGH
jgi:hypothetical protein